MRRHKQSSAGCGKRENIKNPCNFPRTDAGAKYGEKILFAVR